MDGLPSARNERERLERELLAKMRFAESAYRAAVAEHREIRSTFDGLLDHPDGALALRKAATKERIAIEGYRRALNAFNELILYGRRPILPPE